MIKEFKLTETYSTNLGNKTGKEIFKLVNEIDSPNLKLIIDKEGYTLRQSHRTGEWSWVKAHVTPPAELPNGNKNPEGFLPDHYTHGNNRGYQITRKHSNNVYAHNKWYRNDH